MKRILINGWHAGMGAVGQGAYANRLLRGLARHVDREHVEVIVLVPEGRTLALSPLQVEALPYRSRGHAVLDTTAWNYRVLTNRRAADAHTIFFSPGPVWGLRAPPRMAITYHDCIYRHFPVYLGRWGLRRWMLRWAERYLHRARVVFTESDHARADIAAHTGVPIDRIVAIPAWLPPEFSPAAAKARAADVRARYRLPDRYWLYLGGYDVRKNVEFLVRAYAKARRATTCPPLVLAGRIPTRRAPTLCDVNGARSEAGLDASALVEPGFIADADLPALYAGAELFVYPSLMEGYGLPPMEAMGCGCPALVADNSSLREVVRDAAYRFDTRSPDALVDRLIHAAREKIPLNPSFDPAHHDERAAMCAYVRALTRELP